MKKKLVSILLSGALLASSLLATFTVVAAGNTAPVGETAVPAVTAAPAEETAAPAEAAPAEAAPAEVAAPEAAPAEVAAPVTAAAPEAATVAADVPMPIAGGDKTVDKDGTAYNVTVLQDFENYDSKWLTPSRYIVAQDSGVSTDPAIFHATIADNGIGGTKSVSLPVGTAACGFTKLTMMVPAAVLDGEGLYFEVATDGNVGQANGNQKISLWANNGTKHNHGDLEVWAGLDVGTGLYETGNFCVNGTSSQYTTSAPYAYTVPWSDLKIDPTTFDLDGATELCFRLSWNNTSFPVSGSYAYIDNIGFYGDHVEPGVDAVSSYTAYQNSLQSDNDASTSDTQFSKTVTNGVATFTLTSNATPWNNRISLKLSDSGVTATQYIDFDVAYGNAVPEGLPLTLRLSATESNAGTDTVGGGAGTDAHYLAINSDYITGEYPNYHYHVPVADFTLKNNKTLADAKWLTVNFATNVYTITPGETATFAYSNLKVVESETVTFDPDAKVVNVKPTVSDNSALDVSVTNNGDHDITWSDAKDVSLQVKEGASVTLTAKPAEGMEAVWTGIPGQGELTQDTVTFTATEEANPSVTFRAATGIKIKATSEESVKITVAAKNGQSATGELSGIEKDTEVTLTAPAESGTKKFSCWKHKDNIISYEHEMKVLAKDTTAYTAVYADAPEAAKSTLTFYSITKDSADSQVVAVFEWHLTSGDVEGKHIGEVKLNITGNGGSKSKTFNSYDIHYQNGYYTLTIKFADDIPDDLTFTITLEGIDSTVTATSTVDMISGI